MHYIFLTHTDSNIFLRSEMPELSGLATFKLFPGYQSSSRAYDENDCNLKQKFTMPIVIPDTRQTGGRAEEWRTRRPISIQILVFSKAVCINEEFEDVMYRVTALAGNWRHLNVKITVQVILLHLVVT